MATKKIEKQIRDVLEYWAESKRLNDYGEVIIEELGYWVDGYDKENNVIN